MKNNPALYFDIWRKRGFKNLIKAYTKVAENHNSKEDMRENFGVYLDKYAGGRGKYVGTEKQWHSAYTLGRELGVFLKESDSTGYELSTLAKAALSSKITLEDYLLIYLLNLNQLVNNNVVHPLKEVLTLFETESKITKESIKNIASFNLSVKTDQAQNQQVNVLIHRMIESEIIIWDSNGLTLTRKYELSDLLESINEFSGTIIQFRKIDHTQFVEMLSSPVKLIPHYKVGA